jgi:xanthine/uracil/vitamin C permease (AzgA family)
VLVALLMAAALRGLVWDDIPESLPGVVLAVATPFTFSIAAGIGPGSIAPAVVRVVAG